MEINIAVALIVAAVIVFVMLGVRPVAQAQVKVVERLGKFHKIAESGLNFILPLFDKVRSTVDLRERAIQLTKEPVITKDNVSLVVGSVIYYQVIDPVKSCYEIADFQQAIQLLTATSLRNVMGGLTLDETLTGRDTVNQRLRMVLDDATEKWGVKVTRVELKELDTPKQIQEAMSMQMTAERERRARVTAAEGAKQAAILEAEGAKASRILQAEADRDASVARAEGEKKAQVLAAEARAASLKLELDALNEAAISRGALAYKYIEALQRLATSQNKVFVPFEAASVAGALGGLQAVMGGDSSPVRETVPAPTARVPVGPGPYKAGS